MIIKGQPGPHFMGERIEIDPSGAARSISRWEGTEAEVKGMAGGLRNAKAAVLIDRIGNTPVWFAEAVRQGLGGSSDDNLTETFELVIGVNQQPLANNAVLRTILSNADIVLAQQIKDHLETAALTAGVPSYTYNDALVTITAQATAPVRTLDYLNLLLRGVQSFYQVADFTLVLTQTFARGSSRGPNYTNVGKVYGTSGALISGESLNGMPMSLPDKQWLKLGPDYRVQYEGMAEIIYRYLGADEWSTLLYADAA